MTTQFRQSAANSLQQIQNSMQNLNAGAINVMDGISARSVQINNWYAAAGKDSVSAAGTVAASLSYMSNGVNSAVGCYQSGRYLEGTAYVLDVIGSITAISGIIAGGVLPGVGILITAVLGIVSLILRAFEKPEESLIEQIKKLLDAHRADELVNKVSGILDNLTVIGETLESYEDGKVPWDKLNSIGGFTNSGYYDIMGEAKNWLLNKDSQKIDLWESVCEVYIISATKDFANLTIALSKVIDDDRKHALSTIKTRVELYNIFCSEIRSVISSRDLAFHIGHSKNNYALYKRKQIVSDDGWNKLGGDWNKFSILPFTRQIVLIDSDSTKRLQLSKNLDLDDWKKIGNGFDHISTTDATIDSKSVDLMIGTKKDVLEIYKWEDSNREHQSSRGIDLNSVYGYNITGLSGTSTGLLCVSTNNKIVFFPNGLADIFQNKSLKKFEWTTNEKDIIGIYVYMESDLPKVWVYNESNIFSYTFPKDWETNGIADIKLATINRMDSNSKIKSVFVGIDNSIVAVMNNGLIYFMNPDGIWTKIDVEAYGALKVISKSNFLFTKFAHTVSNYLKNLN